MELGKVGEISMSCENKIPTLVRLAPEDAETLTLLAERQQRTKSDVIARLLYREALQAEQPEAE